MSKKPNPQTDDTRFDDFLLSLDTEQRKLFGQLAFADDQTSIGYLSNRLHILDPSARHTLSETDTTPCRILRTHGGPFIAITKGVDYAEKIGNAFPDSLISDYLEIGLFKIVNALKAGDLSRADALVAILSETFDLPDLDDCTSQHNPELIVVLFMKAIYSDQDISDTAMTHLFSMLAALPKHASLMRGMLYNVGLDVFLRRNEMAMAEEAAQRALFHYHAAGEDGVEFYVHLYLAIINLWRGTLPAAQTQLDDAARALRQFQGATDNDALLLRSFQLIAAYETGHETGFVQHLLKASDNIPFGEIWPSVAEPIISYGRRALACKVTPAAALSWVRRWRVRQWRSKRFDALISTQEVLALQELGRWQEAEEVLATIQDGFGQDLQLARFAAALDRAPGSVELAQKLGAGLTATNLSLRQSAMLRLMSAHSAIRRGTEREAVRHLGQAIRTASPETLPAFWSEQQTRIADILNNRELKSEMRRYPQLYQQFEKLAQGKPTQKPNALTRQEYRVLLLLAEAQSNKAIGLRLGVSLATVKFHVTNLCRKAGVNNRKAVVQHALNAGWLPPR